MSTIVIAKYRADPSRFEKLVKADDVDFTAVARARISKGCISHRYAAVEAGLEEPPEITYLRVVPDPGAFYRYPG